MALTEHERDQAIKEAHNIAASEAYFEVRAGVVYPQPHTIFDAAFSRGWDAGRAPLLERIAAMTAQVEQAAQPVAEIIINEDEFELGLTDDFAFGKLKLPNGHHMLYTAPPKAVPLTDAQEHETDGDSCWCDPDTAYEDPETGAKVIVHRRPQ